MIMDVKKATTSTGVKLSVMTLMTYLKILLAYHIIRLICLNTI